MKIISWNCNCAFRNKFHLLMDEKPDVMIIPESESPEYLESHRGNIPARCHLWAGKTPSKGLSIFTFNGYSARIADFYNPNYKFIVPVEIRKGTHKFLLFAVWTITAENNNTYSGYVVQACKALQYYRPQLREDSILAGDFNSNKLWDTHFTRSYNHSSLIELLCGQGFFSLYHHLRGEAQGEETTGTLYMLKQENRPYHIDYFFMHHSLMPQVKKFQIGTYADWIAASDHMPLTLEIF